MKLQLSTMGLVAMIMLIGCGGDGSSSKESKREKVSKREYIVITYNYPKKICKSSYLKNELKSLGAKDIVVLTENDYVNCATYGKVNNGDTCYTQDTNYYSEPTCVVGVNRVESNYYKPLSGDKNGLFLEDIQDSVVSAF